MFEFCLLTLPGEDCFERGRDFVPERWYDKLEMVRNKAAYTPFGTGKIMAHPFPAATIDLMEQYTRPSYLPWTIPRFGRHEVSHRSIGQEIPCALRVW